MDLCEFVAANVLLPLGGVLIVIFAGWMLARSSFTDELRMGDGIGYRLWRLPIRYVAPIGVAIVLLNAIGLLKLIGLD